MLYYSMPNTNKIDKNQVHYVEDAATYHVQLPEGTLNDQVPLLAMCLTCVSHRITDLPPNWEGKCTRVQGEIKDGGLCMLYNDIQGKTLTRRKEG